MVNDEASVEELIGSMAVVQGIYGAMVHNLVNDLLFCMSRSLQMVRLINRGSGIETESKTNLLAVLKEMVVPSEFNRRRHR